MTKRILAYLQKSFVYSSLHLWDIVVFIMRARDWPWRVYVVYNDDWVEA